MSAETKDVTTNNNSTAEGASAPSVVENILKTAPINEVKKPLLYFGQQVRIGSRKIKIVRIEHFNLIPKTKEAQGIRDEVTLKIGSQWKVGTRDIIRGLSPEEERRFLPKILGVGVSSEKWDEKCLLYWADFSIQIPNNDQGIILEAGYKIERTGAGEEIVPINLDDYMKYKFCLENGKVANEDQDNPLVYDFKIVDLAKDEEAKEKIHTAKKSIETVYLKLIQSNDSKERLKIDWILETIGGPDGKGISIAGLSDIQKEMKLEVIKNENLDEFIKVVNDEDLQFKAVLRKAVSVGKLDIQGETYFYGNKAIGNLNDTIGYFKNPNNIKDYQIILQAIK